MIESSGRPEKYGASAERGLGIVASPGIECEGMMDMSRGAARGNQASEGRTGRSRIRERASQGRRVGELWSVKAGE